MKRIKHLQGVRALVVGIGLHGGGVATIKWLHKQGAKITATDLRNIEELLPSLKKLKGYPVKYTLGKHDNRDIRSNDLVVVNPGVPNKSPFMREAMRQGMRIENDASLFFRFDNHLQIGVTGTRGKTTTTLFLAQLLKKKYPGIKPSGNTPDNALLKEYLRAEGKTIPIPIELSSWQLEYLPMSKRAPHIAVITNLFPDHLNRYKNIDAYADAKANIFKHQLSGDYLILNKHNSWTSYFLKKQPTGMVFFVSKKQLLKKENGIFLSNQKLFFQADGTTQTLVSVAKFVEKYGTHNLDNLMCALLAVKLYDPMLQVTERDILKLTLPPMRQEEVVKMGRVRVINDSCATSPDGTIAAIERFRSCRNLILIAGGTNKSLEYNELGSVIRKTLLPEQVILLEGSATRMLTQELGKLTPRVYPTLDQCVKAAYASAVKSRGDVVVLFSPGAASFEKFLHEFDRGKKFNSLVKKIFN